MVMFRRLKKYFFTGLAVFLPFLLTLYISVWILNFFESILGRYLRPLLLEYYDFYFWGIGIIVLLVLIMLFGFLATNYFGRVVHRSTEKLFLSVPLLGNIYPAFKEIAKFLFREDSAEDKDQAPQQVVLVEWPREGSWSVGFLTNRSPEEVCAMVGRELVSVLIPTVPNPLTGFVVMIPKEKVFPLKMSMEDAVKIVVSGGVVIPHVAGAGDPSSASDIHEKKSS